MPPGEKVKYGDWCTVSSKGEVTVRELGKFIHAEIRRIKKMIDNREYDELKDPFNDRSLERERKFFEGFWALTGAPLEKMPKPRNVQKDYKENIYYCFKETAAGYKKYMQARTIYFYDDGGRVIKELDYYRWKKDLQLSAVRIYEYDEHNNFIYEEVRQVLAKTIEKTYHVYDKKGKKLQTIGIEFDCRNGRGKATRGYTIDYFYDRHNRLEKDIMNMSPRHFSETRYFYDGAKRKPVRKAEYLQLGKGNRWWTTYYYDANGCLKKEAKSYKKGPMSGKSFTTYYYDRSQKICVTSDGERTVTVSNGELYSTKWYDSDGALTRYTVMREVDGMNIVWSWEYACDCNGVVVRPVFESITKYKYRK